MNNAEPIFYSGSEILEMIRCSPCLCPGLFCAIQWV